MSHHFSPAQRKVLVDDAVTLMIEACDTDDVLWETRATGQDTEEAEASGMLVGYKEALEAVQRLLNHGDAGPLRERLALVREEMLDAQQEVEEAKPGEIHFWTSGEERMVAVNESLAREDDETMELVDAQGRVNMAARVEDIRTHLDSLPHETHPDAEALTVADALRHVQQMHPLDLAARVEDIHMHLDRCDPRDRAAWQEALDVTRGQRPFGGPPDDMLDQLASLARTAIDDPENLDPERMREELESYWPGASPEGDATIPSLNRLYAISKQDAIINALNPAEETRETFAATLTILGRHLAERADVMRDVDADVESGEKAAYERAANRVHDALDILDEAMTELRGEDA